MAVVNLTATSRGDRALTESVTTRDGMNVFTSTVEVNSDDTATSTYFMARFPSNVRLMALSRLDIDDLASTGSPTLDIGTFAVGANITSSATSINDGIDAATAANGIDMIKDPADAGKYLWEIAGESSDPGGKIDVKISLLDANVNVGGTVTATFVYWVDNS